jgi:hypothetical protein
MNLFSVADPGCLSQIPDPDFYPSSWIQKQRQKRGVKKKFVILFFVATNFTKNLVNNFIFEMLKKKKLAQFSNNNFLPKKLSIVTKPSKI